MISSQLISIIIPIYNTKHEYFEKCINSLLSQTFRNIEVIIIDDGSSIENSIFYSQYVEMDNRVKYFYKTNKGLSDSRNVGIEKATGQYGMFVDSDDWLDNDCLEIVLECMNKFNVDVVFWGYMREYFKKSKPRFLYNQNHYFDKDQCKKILCRKMFGLYKQELHDVEKSNSIVPVCMKLYKMELLRKYYFIDAKIIGTCEDGLFNAELFHDIHSAYYINKALYHYRKSNASLTRGYYKSSLANQYFVLFSEFEKLICNLNLDREFSEALDNRRCMSLVDMSLNEIRNPKGLVIQVKDVNKWLRKDEIVSAFSKLDFSYFKLYWKIFFFFAKRKHGLAIIVLANVISIIK